MSFASRRRAMFITLSIVYQLVFLHGVVMTTVANDIMRDMGLSSARMGFLGSAYLYAYAGVMLVSGMAAAWIGPRKTLTLLFVVSGAGGLLFAASGSFETAAVGRAMSGMGMAACMTSSFTLFSRWYPPHRYSRMCSLYFAIGGLGTLLGIGPLAPLCAAWGWRAVFMLIAVLTLAYGAGVFLVVRDWPPDDVAELAGAGGLAKSDYGMALLWRSVRQVAKSPDFWRIIVWFLTLPGMYFAFCGLWAVPYLRDVYGMSRSGAGALVSIVAIGFIVGTPSISALADSLFKSYRAPAGWAGVVTALGSAYLIWRIDRMGTVEIAALMLIVGMALNAPNACIYAAARNLFGPRMAGITGGVFGCSAFLGGAALQIVCGWLLDLGAAREWTPAQAYAAAFAPFIACGIIGAVAGFTLSKNSFRA